MRPIFTLEFAGSSSQTSELLLPLLVGMGVHELSMTAQHILSTRERIRSFEYKACQELVLEVLRARDHRRD